MVHTHRFTDPRDLSLKHEATKLATGLKSDRSQISLVILLRPGVTGHFLMRIFSSFNAKVVLSLIGSQSLLSYSTHVIVRLTKKFYKCMHITNLDIESQFGLCAHGL